jgi:hypothetical protein
VPTELSILDVLRKTLVIIGCLVFLFSIISPFFLFNTPFYLTSNYYWSYRRDFYGGFGATMQFWFFNNWEKTVSATMSWALISLFIFQVLTLVFAVGSFFFNRRILSVAPVLLCLGVLGLMIYTEQTISGVLGEYRQGYYLIFPSLALFISAFTLNEVTKKQQTKDFISV